MKRIIGFILLQLAIAGAACAQFPANSAAADSIRQLTEKDHRLDAKNKLTISIAGLGTIAAIDNGDAADLGSFLSRERRRSTDFAC